MSERPNPTTTIEADEVTIEAPDVPAADPAEALPDDVAVGDPSAGDGEEAPE